MTNDPTISVLMSVYNGMPYLEEAIRSIQSQTFEDWELIILDDASTDQGVVYIESILREDQRIVLVRNDHNFGQGTSLNRGLALCRGAWVGRMDGDDIALPERFERQLAFLHANPDVKATSCLAYYIDRTGKRLGKTIAEVETREKFNQVRARNLPIGILHPGAMIDRELFQSLGGYRPEFGGADDIDLWCRISDHDLLLVQAEYLMEYRVHSQALSAQSYEKVRLKHLWARDAMIARRSGLPEPTWGEFTALRNNAPLGLKLNRWRKMQAKRLYRHSAESYAQSLSFRTFVEIGLATLLQPSYTLRRLKGQLLR